MTVPARGLEAGAGQFPVQVDHPVAQFRRGRVDVADPRDRVDSAGAGGVKQGARTGLAHGGQHHLGGGDGAAELSLFDRPIAGHPFVQQPEHGIWFIRAECGFHIRIQFQPDQGLLMRASGIEWKPVARVRRSPESALAGPPVHPSGLDVSNLAVVDALSGRERKVVTTEGHALLVEEAPAVVIKDLAGHGVIESTCGHNAELADDRASKERPARMRTRPLVTFPGSFAPPPNRGEGHKARNGVNHFVA